KKSAVTGANSGRWERLAKRFERIPQEFPRSGYADDALFHAGKSYYELYGFNQKESTLDLAIKNWRALISRYPAAPLAQEARYRLGLSFEEGKGDETEARARYQELVDKHPRGEWAAKARKRLEAMKLADEEREKKGKTLLTQIRYTSSQNYTRITMDLSTEIRFETRVLKEEPSKGLPPRIYVDLLGARLGMSGSQPIVVEDRLLKQVRVGQFSQDVVRVVLDMSSLADHKAFLLPDPYRLIIDIQGQKGRGELVAVEKKRDSAPPKALKPVTPGLRKIVLDPGHGGKDPGAIGVNGILEKDIVLAVAKKLAKRLRAELGIQVVLTREDDSFIPLEDRTAVANAEDADLFISLHVNSSPNPEAKGVETYYLDNTTDEASIRLAARENSTSRRSISDLQFILSDLTQNSKLEDSITLAHRLHSSVVSHVGQKRGAVKDLGVKKALFYVLVGARMPSVLVELFFITHKIEGRALARRAYQDTLVEALVEGIKKYQDSTQVVKDL
ncbi:MAG: N-acetylmuramoyl-L-alanine amidase, partial [Deltaproteobacteria bacterium]|nr:N-acetylmuramoyl-L-alanine amidase [Deltaproteobacteria bacterium]